MRHWKVAVDELAVLVGQELHAGLLAGLADRLGVLGPMLDRNAAHGDAAVLAVPFIAEVEVALDLLEIGQDLVPLPALGAARRPFGIVGRRAAVGHLAVD